MGKPQKNKPKRKRRKKEEEKQEEEEEGRKREVIKVYIKDTYNRILYIYIVKTLKNIRYCLGLYKDVVEGKAMKKKNVWA